MNMHLHTFQKLHCCSVVSFSVCWVRTAVNDLDKTSSMHAGGIAASAI